MLSKIHRPYNFVMFSNYCRIPMGSWGLPRVPRIPENSKGYKVLKFPKDPKLSKIFGSPRISKMSLDLQSSQGSKLLIFIMLSKIHRSLNFVMFSNYILRGTQEINLLRGAPETQGRNLKTHLFLYFHMIFMFLDHRKNIQINSSTSLCIPCSWVSDRTHRTPCNVSFKLCDFAWP